MKLDGNGIKTIYSIKENCENWKKNYIHKKYYNKEFKIMFLTLKAHATQTLYILTEIYFLEVNGLKI